MERLLKKPEDDTWTHRQRTLMKDAAGETFPAELYIQYLPLNQANHQWILIANDITDRVDQERAQNRLDRLKSIGTLAGGSRPQQCPHATDDECRGLAYLPRILKNHRHAGIQCAPRFGHGAAGPEFCTWSGRQQTTRATKKSGKRTPAND